MDSTEITCRESGDPWGVKQHRWQTGAKNDQQLNPEGPNPRQ